MSKKNLELANAVIIISAISLGIQAFVGIAIIVVATFSMMAIFEYFSAGFFSVAILVMGISLVVKICALIFAIKGKNQVSKSYVLTAAILNIVCAVTGDVLCVASCICGFVLYSNLDVDETVAGGKAEYISSDNIYGMK